MFAILSNIPLWVFPLFILLLFVGLRARRRRSVPLVVFYVLPLLGVLSIRNVALLDPGLWIWALASAAYGLSLWAGWRWQAAWTIAKRRRHVEVRGEWVTLCAVMVLFAAGFVLGFLRDVAPEAAGSLLFHAIYCAALGLAAGQFLGRSLRVLLCDPLSLDPALGQAAPN